MKRSYLILNDGESYAGWAPEWQAGAFSGEVVFTTGMTGYYESLTDPSFAGQILVFTYPLIGNYGVADSSHWESAKIQVRGVVVSENAPHFSHHAAISSLLEWLQKERIPLLMDVDTRRLTKHLRAEGTVCGTITDAAKYRVSEDPNSNNLVATVSQKERKVLGAGSKRIIAVDCGMKESLMRNLLQLPIEVVRVPYDYDYNHEEFDGLFLSNGPGDPMQLTKTVEILRRAMERKKPIFGVCLGNQMLALAAGAKTYKLSFGHRGQNQPCIDVTTRKCYITSQNHGYAVDEKTLPEQWQVNLRNLNDNSVEGIAHKELPFFSVQFHPEASPGPTDTRFYFERFYRCL